MHTPKTARFLIVCPMVGWHVILPFVVMALARFLTKSELAMWIAVAVSVALLVNVPARLVISSFGLQIRWLGRRRADIQWHDVAGWHDVVEAGPFWLRGMWIELKSGRRLLLMRSVNTRSRAAELRDAIVEQLGSHDQ